MSYVVLYFECPSCGEKWEDLVDSSDRTSECPSCQQKSSTTFLSAPYVAGFSTKTREEQLSSLKKRSQDHGKKLMKQNADKWFPGKAR